MTKKLLRKSKLITSTITIDNRDKISENSNEFLYYLLKSLKIKFLHSMTRSMRMQLIKMRNLKGLKNDIFYQQSWGFFQSLPESFLIKVANVTLLKKTPARVVSVNFATF